MRHIVYIISNMVNGKIYIGATSKSWQSRWDQHIMECNKKCNSRYPLYVDIIKYGANNFCVDELEECVSRGEMLRKEIHWIKKLKSGIVFGNYNIKHGQTVSPYEVNEQVIDGIKKAIIGKSAKWLCEKSSICKSRFSKMMRGRAEIYPNELEAINKVLGTSFKL
jgi:group I intron endonuclease